MVYNVAMALSYSYEHIIHSELFWIAAGSTVTAAALVYTLLKDRLESSGELRNAKRALLSELMLDIDMLFSGEVERKPLDQAIYLIRSKFSGSIQDQSRFDNIQRIYADLDYYQTFVGNVYLKPHVQDNGAETTWKQLQICNRVIKALGGTPVPEDREGRVAYNQVNPGKEYFDFLRD